MLTALNKSGNSNGSFFKDARPLWICALTVFYVVSFFVGVEKLPDSLSIKRQLTGKTIVILRSSVFENLIWTRRDIPIVFVGECTAYGVPKSWGPRIASAGNKKKMLLKRLKRHHLIKPRAIVVMFGIFNFTRGDEEEEIQREISEIARAAVAAFPGAEKVFILHPREVAEIAQLPECGRGDGIHLINGGPGYDLIRKNHPEWWTFAGEQAPEEDYGVYMDFPGVGSLRN